MAAVKFPNRPCPKCGKPIHIKTTKHEECGWTAASAAPVKQASGKTAPAGEKPQSKMDAVRRILSESGKDTMPVEIQSQLHRKFRIKMDTATISTYKGTILRQGAPKKKMGRPMGRPAGVSTPAASGSISIEDIQAVKALADRLGPDKLRQLPEVLA
jgi:hypothetical protein